ncbi:Acid phosphatase [Mycena sanguinolenta]|uniref:Acid phosphatase n=1 Tax=Mycena sanguinolenta TaxID=230812 RepID=A0A8H6XW23_9AGAR|nr:Acid phosphatase [Mycena sanguinolenta]
MLLSMHFKAALALAATGIFFSPVSAATTVIPITSFDNYTIFEQFWSYLYPWGSDHNGSARMVGNSTDHSHIALASSTLSLIATPTSNAVPPTSTNTPTEPIHYASGTVYAQEQITVTCENSYTVSGDFSSPTVFGTWPAFCMIVVLSPVLLRFILIRRVDGGCRLASRGDVGEWKGTNNNWFNTFNTSSIVKSTLVPWPADLSFHNLKAVLTAEPNGVDVRIDFSMDGVFQVTQFGEGFVGKALWLIIDLQASLCVSIVCFKANSFVDGGQFWISWSNRYHNLQDSESRSDQKWFLRRVLYRRILCTVAFMQIIGGLRIAVLAFFAVLLNSRLSFAQNSSNPLSFSPAPSVFADLEDMPQVLRTKTPSTVSHDEALPYTYRPPQAPLDVKGYPAAPPDLKLEQVHVYVRHGERTPVGIRLAPFIPEHWIMCKTRRHFSPVSGNRNDEGMRTRRVVERKDGSATEGLCLLGELTDIGRKSTFNFGTALRSLYIDRLGFLPDLLQPEEAYFRSTNMPRTIESLEQVIHGLYPSTKCSPNALPTLLVRNGRDENLLGNTMSCKRLEYLQIGFAQAAAAAYNQTLEPLDKHLSKYLDGRPIRIDGRPRASGVLDTVRAAVAHGVKVPAEFEDKAITDVIEQAVVAEWFADKTHEVRRLGMGPLLSDLAAKMARKAELGAEDPLKVLVHSTHDTALAATLSTLDVFDEKYVFDELISTCKTRTDLTGGRHLPHISLFELFKRQPPESKRSYLQTVLSPFTAATSPEYFVRMRYQNKNMVLPVCAEEGKHLPGSPEFCTLAAFRERVKELTPVDWDAECASTGWS